MKKSINILIFSAFVSGVCTTSVDAAALSNPPETAATTAPAAQGEFFIAKAIAKEAKADGNYVRMLALRYFGADGLANINDFGEGFFEYGCGDESWELLLSSLPQPDGGVKLSDLAEASFEIRKRMLPAEFSIDPTQEYEQAKRIARHAKETQDYALMYALHLFYIGQNVDDFGEGFFEYGCGDESWEKLLDEMRTCDGFVEPSPSEIAAASRRVRAIILGHENL